jgi:putative tryptophan/tyrosine transport system substrate-binding protein
MRRRNFIRLVGFIGGAAACPLALQAQQPLKRVAMVHPSEKVGNMTIAGRRTFQAFFEEIGALGYVEGRNLLLERYSGEGRADHYAELARDVVDTRPDLIIAMTLTMASAFKAATTTIPIVAATTDPVASGLVNSLAHPGGNITGVSVDAGIEIWGKRLGLLKEALPQLSQALFLQAAYRRDLETSAVREAANRVGISLAVGLLSSGITEASYQTVFTSMRRDQVDGLIVSDEAEHLTYRSALVELAAKNQIPAIYPFREFAEVGGLLVYSVDLGDISRRIANLMDKILKGANPGDIPFFQQTKFELIVNLRTSKALGLQLPATLVARADEVIE